MFNPNYQYPSTQYELISLQTVRYRTQNTLRSRRRLLYDARLQPKVAKTVPVRAVNVKSFPSRKTHRAALISVFITISQTPDVYTAM